MKQLGLAIIQYTQDYDECQPSYQYGTYNASFALNTQYQWHDAIYPYVKSAQVYNCPSHAYTTGQGALRTTFLQPATGVTCLGINGASLISYAANRTYYNLAAQPTCLTSSCPNYSQPYASAMGAFATSSTVVKLSRIARPAETAMLLEYNASTVGGASSLGSDLLGTGAAAGQVYRHFDRANVLFADGHAKSLSGDDLTTTHNVKATSSSTMIPVAYLLTVQDD